MPLADAGKGEYLGGSRQPIDGAGLVEGGHSTPSVDLEPFDRRGRFGAQHAAFRETGHAGNDHPAREIASQLSERNIGAVLFAGSETGGDMLNTHGGSLEAVAQAIDTVLAAGKEFGLPVAMTSTTNMMERIEQGARLFTGGVTPALRREAGR